MFSKGQKAIQLYGGGKDGGEKVIRENILA
jgi:hypothetical protein